MPVELIGLVPHSDSSEIKGGYTDPVDVDFIDRIAAAHEAGGFDRVLVAFSATTPDCWPLAARVLFRTERLGVLVANRPGFVAPTLLARTAATTDQLSGGRVAVHFITGGNEADQRRDGDFLGHDDRYRRSHELISVFRRVLEAEEPFDHQGEFYRFEGAFSHVKPIDRIPVFFGGSSPAAIPVGAELADVYMVWGEPRAALASFFDEVRAAAAPFGRSPSFSVSLRPILADTEDAAWARAEAIARTTQERVDAFVGKNGFAGGLSSSVGRLRLVEHAGRSDVHDERLWTKVAGITRAGGNTTALVGTAEQVAEALLRYYDLGADRILIRGFDPLEDAVEYGDKLLPLVRAGVAARDAELAEAV